MKSMTETLLQASVTCLLSERAWDQKRACSYLLIASVESITAQGKSASARNVNLIHSIPESNSTPIL